MKYRHCYIDPQSGVVSESISIPLVTIILVLLIFYIKHYYFLENTVQKMYRIYDSILEKQRKFKADTE